MPEYRIEDAGPDHAKTFTAWAVVGGQMYGGVDGGSKKEAEQRAAEAAWQELCDPEHRTRRVTRERCVADTREPARVRSRASGVEPPDSTRSTRSTSPESAAPRRPA